MSAASERYFPCVPLGATGADEPHHWVIADVLAARRSRHLRSAEATA